MMVEENKAWTWFMWAHIIDTQDKKETTSLKPHLSYCDWQMLSETLN